MSTKYSCLNWCIQSIFYQKVSNSNFITCVTVCLTSVAARFLPAWAKHLTSFMARGTGTPYRSDRGALTSVNISNSYKSLKKFSSLCQRHVKSNIRKLKKKK